MQETVAIELEHVAITGAASGIGAACAEKLKARNIRITAFDVRQPTANIDHYIELDIGNEASVDAAISKARHLGPFDAILNIAGVPPKPGLEQSILAINWVGQRRFTEGLLKQIRAGGSIVNMASRAGSQWLQNIEQVKALMDIRAVADLAAFLQAHPMDATRAYMLSKEAMVVWTMADTAALQSQGLRMNSVSPAAVNTGILGDFITAFGDKVQKNLARVGRAGTAAEIADVTLFLASPESHWLRGIDITVDGGMSAIVQSEMLGLPSTNPTR